VCIVYTVYIVCIVYIVCTVCIVYIVYRTSNVSHTVDIDTQVCPTGSQVETAPFYVWLGLDWLAIKEV
jgi:hypothetical protein